MTINAPAAILLLLYELVGEEQGVGAEKLRGTVQNDVLKEYVARGNYIYPPEATMRLTTDIFEYCREHVPKWNTISISGYHIREKGCSAVQEVAFTLANAIAYVEAALDAGLAVDEFAPRLAFFFNCHNNVFQEIAKFRAVRRMWAQDHARALRRHRRALADDPLPHPDRRRDAPGAAARGEHHPGRAAGLRGGRRRHPVAAHERLRRGARAADRALGADRAPHPAGARSRVGRRRHGRPVRRLLLHRVAHRRDRGARLGADRQGRAAGRLACRRSSSSSARSRSRPPPTTSATERGQDIIVGRQQVRDRRGRRRRDPAGRPGVRAAPGRAPDAVQGGSRPGGGRGRLEELREVAEGEGNLLYPIKDALRDGASIGEVCGAMREVFGEYKGGAFF